MSKLAIISARQMIAILLSMGFEEIRQKGSHKFFAHSDGRTTVIPDHTGEDLGRGLIRKILQDIELSPEEYEQLRQR
jgi:predicted RNA binding protein YcfA (HicA-like mRNA interferase family)